MDLDSGVNGAYRTPLPSSQEHRNMCPGPLVVAHTRPTKSSQPHRVQEWLSKSKPKVPAQMQHWQMGCHLSWCSIYIQSETSIWHCVLRENTRIWDVHVQQPQSAKHVITKDSDPSRMKVWIPPSKGEPPRPAEVTAAYDGNLEWSDEEREVEYQTWPLSPATVTGA